MRLFIILTSLTLMLTGCHHPQNIYTIKESSPNADGTVNYLLINDQNDKLILRSKPKASYSKGTKIKFS